MTTEQIKVRLTADEMKSLRALSELCGPTMTCLAAMFIRAGLKAVKDNGGTFHVPLDVQIKPFVPPPEPGAKKR